MPSLKDVNLVGGLDSVGPTVGQPGVKDRHKYSAARQYKVMDLGPRSIAVQ